MRYFRVICAKDWKAAGWTNQSFKPASEIGISRFTKDIQNKKSIVRCDFAVIAKLKNVTSGPLLTTTSKESLSKGRMVREWINNMHCLGFSSHENMERLFCYLPGIANDFPDPGKV